VVSHQNRNQCEASKHLALVGMMGVGKSRVGRQVAKLSDRVYIDSDGLITRQLGLSVPEIFEQAGEATFRDLEHKVLLDALASPHASVISTGGGVILRQDNRELLSQAMVVWLQSPVEELAKRLQKSSKKRPLLKSASSASELRDTLANILAEREALYEAVADHKLRVDLLGLQVTVNQVVKLTQLSLSKHR